MGYIITDEELERICDLVHDTHRDLLGQIRLRPLPLFTDLSMFQNPHAQTVPNYRDQHSLINMRLCGRPQIALNIKIKILRLL